MILFSLSKAVRFCGPIVIYVPWNETEVPSSLMEARSDLKKVPEFPSICPRLAWAADTAICTADMRRVSF